MKWNEYEISKLILEVTCEPVLKQMWPMKTARKFHPPKVPKPAEPITVLGK